MFLRVSFGGTYLQHRDLVDVCPAADLQWDLPDRRAVRRILKSRVWVHGDDVIIVRAHDDDIIFVRRWEASAVSGPPALRFRRQEGGHRPELSVDLTEGDKLKYNYI